MPQALLLSPDDQAVSAITAVLEEMSVTCERPLDGVSAAKKLNSHNFDLVLVDCENLPAAKLIFDVCRRGTGGHSPVAIAIVDGRAGLPTAFRLGAELILTKPVAKDQARNTVRTAVSRVKKEEPVRVMQTESSEAPPAEIEALASQADQASTPELLTSYESTSELASNASAQPAETRAMAAAAPAQSPSFQDAPLEALSLNSVTLSAAPALAPEVRPAVATKPILDETRIEPAEALTEDPVLAELENAESEPMAPQPIPPAPVFSAYAEAPKDKKKVSGSLIAILALLVICAGLYAAWMTQPAFRASAQPQVEKVLALAGMARNSPSPAAVPNAVKPVAQPVTVTAPATTADNSQAVPSGSDTSATSSATAATAATPPAAATTAPAIPAPAPIASVAVTKPTAAIQDKTTGDNKVGAQTAGAAKSGSSVAPSAGTLPDEQTAIVLSSKGAEKRLIHSVQPKYPVSAGASEATIVLETRVDSNGNVTDAKLVEGNAGLAEAAISAVKQWKYRPYLRDGKAMPFETIVLIDFQRP
ncbi:MAG TPA: TonB family protein [Terriglobales bacterium]|nr:TonB family protein [Terriglobales bacterium]